MTTPHRRLGLARIRLVRVRGPIGRLRGLLCRARPPGPRTGLWLSPCFAIHTLGMRYGIDVAFIDAEGCVLRLARNLRPGRMALCLRAKSVIELAVNAGDTPLRYRRRLHVALRHAHRTAPQPCGRRVQAPK